MKTNPVFSILIVVMLALVTGCATPGSWQPKIVGTYKGTISNDPDEFPAKTTFKLDEGELSGTYELTVDGNSIDGDLQEFTVTGKRSLKCRWIDYTQRMGNLNMTFSPDFSSFEGNWDPDDFNGSGAWKGRK
jgi:hypothetical protein